MMIRLGIADALRSTVLRTAKWAVSGGNWEIKSTGQLHDWYMKLMTHIRTNEYGVYFALQEVFGIEAADLVAEKGHVKKPDGLVLSPPKAGSSRQPLNPDDHSDDEY